MKVVAVVTVVAGADATLCYCCQVMSDTVVAALGVGVSLHQYPRHPTAPRRPQCCCWRALYYRRPDSMPLCVVVNHTPKYDSRRTLDARYFQKIIQTKSARSFFLDTSAPRQHWNPKQTNPTVMILPSNPTDYFRKVP